MRLHSDRTTGDGTTRLEGRRDNDVAKGNMTLLAALQVDRPGHRFMAVECAACDAGNLLIVNDGCAVLDDGHFAPDERDVEALPNIRTARQFGIRREEAVDATGVMAGRLGLGFAFLPAPHSGRAERRRCLHPCRS